MFKPFFPPILGASWISKMKHWLRFILWVQVLLVTPFDKLRPCFAHTIQNRKGGILLVFKSIWTKLNLIHYFQQSIILIIKKDELNGNHGTMEINHTSHIRTPSSVYGKLREFICAYTLYNHVQTSADIINHWSKQLSDNIHHTHSRYIIISIKQQEASETFKIYYWLYH